jgi:hypothetical protein
VSRTEFDGKRTVLADRHDGKRFNSPNDVVIKSDGSIWFTDPSYGIDSDYEGDAAPSEIGACNVYRIDPSSGRVTVVASDFAQPNGLAFSPDESLLYIADTGLTHKADGPHHVRRFKVSADGSTLAGGEVLATCPAGVYDGFASMCTATCGCRRRWRPLQRERRFAPRQDPDSRSRGQRVLRRAEAESPVHLRDDVAVFGVPQRARAPRP